MAVIALTEVERQQLINETRFKEMIQQKVLFQVAYLKGLSATDLNTFLLQKKRRLAAEVEHNINVLTLDQNITNFVIFRMMARNISNKDNTIGSDLVDNVVGYLNGAARFELLVDDYLNERVEDFQYD
jgi:hypothetical protein